MANQIRYQVDFNVKGNSLNQLKSSLQSLQKLKISDVMKINNMDTSSAVSALGHIKEQALNVEKALKESFNVKLNTTNIDAFNQSLRNSGSSIEQVFSAFKTGGVAGENTFRALSSQVFNTNIQLKQTHSILDKVSTTFVNTIKWNAASTAVNTLTRSVQQAWGFVKSLDTSLNDIRIVTGKSAEEMANFSVKANEAAKSLGKTTTDYTKAALIYAQQGLKDEEIEKRTDITLKVANVTGQSAEAVSEQLTAIWNSYKVGVEDAELYIDRLAAVAATSASDLEQLSTGMSKVASAASILGVSEEQLAAQMSTIISVSRQAPETVGAALKTIYARISDIKAGIDEQGVSLGTYSGKLAELGFNVLDASGNLRDMGEVIEDIGNRWGTLTREQQVSLAQTMAGQRQYSNLMALFDNFQRYNEELAVAQNATGTLQEQQDRYMESTRAHLDQLTASIEKIYMNLVDTGSINGLIDGLSNAAVFASQFIQSIGGGAAALKSLGAIGFSVFSEQIAKGISTTINNFEVGQENARQFNQALQAIKDWEGIPGLDEADKKLLASRKQLLELAKVMTPEQFSGMQNLLNDITNLGNEIKETQAKIQPLKDTLKNLTTTPLEDILGNGQKIDNIIQKINDPIRQFDELTQKAQEVKEVFRDAFFKAQEVGKTSNVDYLNEVFEQAGAQINSLLDNLHDLRNTQAFKGLGKEAGAAFDEIEAEWKDFQDNFGNFSSEEKVSKFKEIFDKISQAASTATGAVKTKYEELLKVLESPEIITSLDQKRQQLNKLITDFVSGQQRMQKAAKIENWAKTAGGIAKVGSAIQQIQNLGSIWKNADLNTGQKLLQTITNLAFSIPMLVTGFKTATTALGLMMVMEKAQAAAELEAATHTYFHIGALSALKLASGEATIAISFLNKTILLNPFVAAAAGILAFAAGLGIVASRAQEAAKTTIKENQNIIEEENKRQEQISQLQTSLDTLNEKQREGQATRSQVIETIESLIEQFGLEGEAADKLRGSYSDLNTAIAEARKEAAEQRLESAKREKDAAEEAIAAKAGLNNDALINDGGYVAAFDFSSNGKIFSSPLNEKDITDIMEKNGFIDVFSDIYQGASNALGLKLEKGYSMDDLVDVYKKVGNTVKEIQDTIPVDVRNDSSYFKAMQDWLEDWKPLIDAYEKANKEFKQSKANLSIFGDEDKNEKPIDFSQAKSLKEYIDKRQELIDRVKEQNKDLQDSEVIKIADNAIRERYKSMYDQYDQAANFIENLKEQLGDDDGAIAKAEEAINQLLTQSPQKFNMLMDQVGVHSDAITSWDRLLGIIASIAGLDLSNVQKVAKGNVDSTRAAVTEKYNNLQSLRSDVLDGKNISSENYDALDEDLQEFFEIAADGTYKMTGNVRDFYDAIDVKQGDAFADAVKETADNYKKSKEILEEGFNFDELNKTAVKLPSFQAFGLHPEKKNVTNDELIDYDLAQKQIDYLKLGVSDTDVALQSLISEWQSLITNQELTAEDAQKIATQVGKIGDKTKEAEENQEAYRQQLVKTSEQYDDFINNRDENKIKEFTGGMSKDQFEKWAQGHGMSIATKDELNEALDAKQIFDQAESLKNTAQSFLDSEGKLKEGFSQTSQDFTKFQSQLSELLGQELSSDATIAMLQQIAQWTDDGSQSAQEYLEWLKQIANVGSTATSIQPSSADQYQQGKQNLSTLQSASDALSNKSGLSDEQAQAIAQLESQNQALADIAAQSGRYSQQYLDTLNETINSQRILNEQKREQARIDTQEQLEALKAQKEQLENQLVTEEEYQKAKQTIDTGGSNGGNIQEAQKVIELYSQQNEIKTDIDTVSSQIIEKEGQLVKLDQQDVSALKDKYQTLRDLYQGLAKKEISKDEYELIRPEALQKSLKALNKTKKQLDSYTSQLLKNNKAFKGNVQAAEDYAVSQWQIEKTIKSLKSNFKTYRKAIQDVADSSEDAKLINSDYQEAIKQLGSSMRDIIGINFSDKFMENADNLNLMQDYLNGDTEALERLRAAALHEIIVSVSTQENDLTEIEDKINSLILQDWDEIVIGANLDDTQFVAGLRDMLANSEITKGQANAILNRIGYHAKISTVGDTVMMRVPVLEWAAQVGDEHVTQISSVHTVMTPVTLDAPVIEGVDSDTGGVGGGGHGASFTPPSSGGSGGGSCFVAGTLVSTDEGFKNIEDIQIGDIVLSYNLKTLQNEYSEVLETMIHDTTENIYSIHIEDDIIKSTGIHKFFIVRNKKMNWISAQNLQTGDSVYFADGTLHKIQQIDIEERSLTVYNFEVSGNHNYYVGKNQILVHNKGKGGCFIAGTLVITEDGFKNIENIQKGDIVLSFNEANNKNEYSEVLETMVHIVHENIYTLHIGNETLVVTGIHRFLITRNNIRSWIHAQDLQVGDFVQYADGTLHEIEQIDIKFDLRTVYNFEVSDNHNYYVGHNGILAHNKGKGGGGGKGKKQEKDTSKKDKEEELKDEIDLYHDVDRELKGINRQLSRLQKQQDKLEGPALQENLNKQLALLEKQVQKLKEKQQIQLKDLEIRRQELKGLGLVFDEYGNITNYMVKCAEWQAIINDLVRQYNDLVEKYNKTTKKSQKEKLEKRIDAVKEKLDAEKKKWEQFKDSVQEYEDLQDSSADNQDSILDINDQIDEIKNGTEQAKDAVQDAINEVEEKWDELIEAFRRPIVFRLDMGQAEKEWNQFRRQVLEHTDLMADPNFKSILADDRRSIRDIGSYFKIGEGIGTLEGLTKQLWATRDEIEAIKKSGSSAVYGPDKDRALEDLSSDLSQLMGQLEDIQSLIDEVDESYFDTIDDAQEHFNKQIDDYAYVRDLIDHDIDLMKILYGDNNYDAMDKYYTTLEQNNNKNLESLRKQRDFWKQQWDDAVARGDTNAAEKFEQNYRNAINNLNSLISESIDNLKNKYENAINKIFDALNNKVSGGKGLDYLSMEWELMTKNTDEYLDTVNSAFAIQQTQRKYQKAIDETKNIKNQQALKKVMEEQLDILKNKERLTQYDVDRAQKLLEIEQARIALEDAQSAKTKLRLKRNTQGNYSYEYIADNSAVSDAQDKLATAQNSLYNFDKDRYKSNLNDMLSAWNDFQSKYKEIILDISLDEEERIAKLALLREEYGEYINGKTEQNLTIRNNLMDSAFQEIASIYQSDVNNYQQMADNEKAIFMEELVPMWNSGIQQMSEKIVGEGGFLPTCDQAFKDITESTKKYKEELDNMADAAGIDLTNVKLGVDDLAKSFEVLIEDNDKLISRMKDEMSAVSQLRAEAEQLIRTYQGVYDSAKQATTAIYEYLRAEQERAAYETQQQAAAAAAAESSTGSSSSSDGSSSSESTQDIDSQIAQAQKDLKDLYDLLNQQDFTIVQTDYKIMTKEQAEAAKIEAQKAVEAFESRQNNIRTQIAEKEKLIAELQAKKSQSSLATGGYTGDWNSNEGQLAILHKKELVLNESDTKNFLNGVTILREISSNLNGNMFSMLNGLSAFKGFDSHSDGAFEQNVHIDASFPNVNSKREIEEAFNELVNMAAQRAMRR